MSYDPHRHRRRSLRLRGYDYAQPGAYFVTVRVRGGAGLLGQVVDGTVVLSDKGRVVAETWVWLEERYPYVTLDAWVVMPNHLHGIIILTDDPVSGKGRSRTALATTTPTPAANVPTTTTVPRTTTPTPAATTPTTTTIPTVTANAGTPKRKPLGRLIGAFKTVSTKRINQMGNTPASPFWQRGFYEHIVRDEGDLACIREYIRANPARWREDPYYT
jgi:REP element-mobilizing transposase RayT